MNHFYIHHLNLEVLNTELNLNFTEPIASVLTQKPGGTAHR